MAAHEAGRFGPKRACSILEHSRRMLHGCDRRSCVAHRDNGRVLVVNCVLVDASSCILQATGNSQLDSQEFRPLVRRGSAVVRSQPIGSDEKSPPPGLSSLFAPIPISFSPAILTSLQNLRFVSR